MVDVLMKNDDKVTVEVPEDMVAEKLEQGWKVFDKKLVYTQGSGYNKEIGKSLFILWLLRPVSHEILIELPLVDVGIYIGKNGYKLLESDELVDYLTESDFYGHKMTRKDIINEAKLLWKQRMNEYVGIHGHIGSAVLGAGLREKGTNQMLIRPDHISGYQGSIVWEDSKDEIIKFLKKNGINVYYDYGRMD